MTIRIAIAGLGKIARDQHLPAIAADPAFTLAATVSTDGARMPGVPGFGSIDELLASDLPVDAVAVCTPPQGRQQVAGAALRRGLHVMLEKPPAASLGEVDALKSIAAAQGASLLAAWHSRHAAGVAAARAWLAERKIISGTIAWREDVRIWHPGQQWIWEAGGLGVFDPGINALSIMTEILPEPLLVRGAALDVPQGRSAPIAARLALETASGATIAADLDFRQTGPEEWDIVLETDGGHLELTNGGAVLRVPGGTVTGPDREYAALYERFAELIATAQSDCDDTPLRLVADALLCGRTRQVAAFTD